MNATEFKKLKIGDKVMMTKGKRLDGLVHRAGIVTSKRIENRISCVLEYVTVAWMWDREGREPFISKDVARQYLRICDEFKYRRILETDVEVED